MRLDKRELRGAGTLIPTGEAEAWRGLPRSGAIGSGDQNLLQLILICRARDRPTGMPGMREISAGALLTCSSRDEVIGRFLDRFSQADVGVERALIPQGFNSISWCGSIARSCSNSSSG